MRHLGAAVAALALLVLPWLSVEYPEQVDRALAAINRTESQLATVILSHRPKTVEDLKSDYDAPARKRRTVKILLVPGHEPDYGGTEYGRLKEHDMTVMLADDLAQFLSANPKYEVIVARNGSSWAPELAEYFADEWEEIVSWRDLYRKDHGDLVRLGRARIVRSSVIHNSADPGPATRLYGINKWANENGVDIALHVHFNDDPRRTVGREGEFTGFSLYVPESQYYNSTTTKAVAQSIFDRLSKYNPVSDFKGEQGGIVEDQDLIAIGAFNTSDAASLLVEYAYIYEPQFADPEVREAAIRDLAFQTYLGIQDFFDPSVTAEAALAYDTLMLPHRWDGEHSNSRVLTAPVEAFALQSALAYVGIYPPLGRSKNDCPRTGRIGPCTKEAIAQFQRAYGIEGELGALGEKTTAKLNDLFGPKEGR